MTAETDARPPCICSSATSSPVNDLGPGKNRTRPWSSSIPLSSRSLVSTACLGGGTDPENVSSPNRTPGPDIRITATPAGGAPEERAKMVSRIFVPVANRVGGLRDLSGIHGIEEVAVRFRLFQLVDQEFDRIRGSHRRKNPPENKNLLQILLWHQKIFLAGTRLENIH